MASTAATAGSKRVLRIVSKCGTEEEFLAVFGRFCDEKSLFVVTATPRAVGSSSRFSITLSDGKPMLVGVGEVIESYDSPANPYGRPGMRMEFTELDADSRALVVRLAAAGRATRTAAVTPMANAPGASPMKKTIMFGVPTVAKGPAPAATPAASTPTPPPTRVTPRSIPAVVPAIPAIRPVTPVPLKKDEPKPAGSSEDRPADRAEDRPAAAPLPAVVPLPRIAHVPRSPLRDLLDKPAADPASKQDEPTIERGPIPSIERTPPPKLDRTPPPKLDRTPPAKLDRTPPAKLDRTPPPKLDRTPPPKADRTPPPKLEPAPSPADEPALPLPPPLAAAPTSLAAAPTPPAAEPAAPLLGAIPETISDELSIPTEVHDRMAGLAIARVGPIDTGEQRAKGSDYILPANPLGELTDASLEAFVECTMYEDTGSIDIGSEDHRTDETPLPPPAPWGGRADETPLPGTGTSPGAVTVTAVSPAPPAMDTPAPDADEPAAAPAWAAAAPAPAPAAGDRMPTDSFERPRRGPGYGMVALIGLGSAAAALGVGYLVWGGARGAGPLAPDPAPAPPVVTAPAGAGDPGIAPAGADRGTDKPSGVEGAEVPQPVEEPSPEPAALAVEENHCGLQVKTQSSGAHVFIAGKEIGITPLSTEVPCTTRQITLRHPRYADAVRAVKLREGETTRVVANLSRPTYTLTINSTPPGATVIVGSRTVGKTPTKVSVNGFENMRVTLMKDGYRSESRIVYVAERRDAVRFTLKKIPTPTRPAPKPAAKPPTAPRRTP